MAERLTGDPFFEAYAFPDDRPYCVHTQKTPARVRHAAPHFHRFFELVCFTGGAGGTVTVDGETCAYEAGDTVVIRPYAMHAYTFASLSQPFVFFRLDTALFSGLFEKAFIQSQIRNFMDYIYSLQPVQRQTGTAVRALLGELPEVSLLGGIARILRFPELLTAVPARREGMPRDLRLARILAYVDSHYAEPLDLATVAERFSMSKFHFSRTFKKVFGTTWVQFLNKIRTERAEQLLVHTSMEITDIALSVGYGDAAYFTKVFRQLHGMPPGAYRKTYADSGRSAKKS